MPLYKFVCKKCNTEFEELVKIGTEKLECPKCSEIAEKVLTKTNWSINGSCWNSLPPKEEKEEKEEKHTKGSKILYDIFCPKCNHIERDVFVYQNEDPNDLCPKCKTKMKKICSIGSFELKYDPKKDICSWGSDGYSTSQYWKDVKEERRKGRKVKGFGEE